MCLCDPSGPSYRIAQVAFRRLNRAAARFLRCLYHSTACAQLTTAQRNKLIQTRQAAGESLSDLAREYGISPQRVWQIVRSE